MSCYIYYYYYYYSWSPDHHRIYRIALTCFSSPGPCQGTLTPRSATIFPSPARSSLQVYEVSDSVKLCNKQLNNNKKLNLAIFGTFERNYDTIESLITLQPWNQGCYVTRDRYARDAFVPNKVLGSLGRVIFPEIFTAALIHPCKKEINY